MQTVDINLGHIKKADTRVIGKFPWAGQFVDVSSDGRDINKVMERAALNYTFHKEQLQLPDGRQVSNYAVVRDDNNEILSHSVGPDWTGLTNAKRFEWFSRYLDKKDATIIAAGEITDSIRTKVAVIARLDHNTNVTISKNDEVAKYLLLSDSFGGSALRPQILVARLICGNGMMGISTKDIITIRHSQRINQKMDIAHDDITLWGLGFEKTTEVYKQLATKDIKNESNLDNYFMNVMEYEIPAGETKLSTRPAKTVAHLKELFADNIHNDGGNSLWTAYNAVTAYINHFVGRSQNSALNSLFYGQGAGRQRRAMETAIEYMGKI